VTDSVYCLVKIIEKDEGIIAAVQFEIKLFDFFSTSLNSSLIIFLKTYTGCSKKTDPQFYFWDNFGNSAPILTILSLLQAEIYGA